MSTTCSVCRGAVPNGVEASGHTALCAEVVRADSARMRAALEELREMMGPKGREAFVMLGPSMFSAVLRVVEGALK